MDGRKYICKCGKQYEDFSGLLRHVSAHEFSYSCTFCSSVYTSHAHRIRHYRVQHPSEPLPRKTVNVHSNGASNEHCTSSQIQCLRVRQQSRKRRERSPPPTVLNTHPQPLNWHFYRQDDAVAHSSGFIDWVINPNIPTPQPLQNDCDIDFLITQASPPSLPDPPTLSFSDLLVDTDTDDDIATLVTPSLPYTSHSTILQTPPSSPVMRC